MRLGLNYQPSSCKILSPKLVTRVDTTETIFQKVVSHVQAKNCMCSRGFNAELSIRAGTRDLSTAVLCLIPNYSDKKNKALMQH